RPRGLLGPGLAAAAERLADARRRLVEDLLAAPQLLLGDPAGADVPVHPGHEVGERPPELVLRCRAGPPGRRPDLLPDPAELPLPALALRAEPPGVPAPLLHLAAPLVLGLAAVPPQLPLDLRPGAVPGVAPHVPGHPGQLLAQGAHGLPDVLLELPRDVLDRGGDLLL